MFFSSSHPRFSQTASRENSGPPNLNSDASNLNSKASRKSHIPRLAKNGVYSLYYKALRLSTSKPKNHAKKGKTKKKSDRFFSAGFLLHAIALLHYLSPPYHSTGFCRITPSAASSAVNVFPRYCTQSITSGLLPLFLTERSPAGATLTTLPSETGKIFPST